VRVAVIGVGLIGGSIGMAARERLDAEVSGFDRDLAALGTAVERGAIDIPATDLATALDGADVAFLSAPVGALDTLVTESLDVAPGDCAVTDVGSTKAMLADHADERFCGGHPLAGAETAGVQHARADLFEGAVWYLTPHAGTSGIVLERLHRIVASFGARPVAINAATHDRLMASVSHLPHVLANVLVAQAAQALGGEAIPPTGPSFRDATRVAGANSAIWTDIYLTNREALVDQIDDTVERLRAVRDALVAFDSGAITAWNDAAAADRKALLESGLEGAEVFELRAMVPNRPGVIADIALALGRAGVNIVDMALSPSAGVRLREAREVTNAIDVGNAGTLMRLLPGWLAAQEGRAWRVDGDESIRRRPIDRIAEPLRRMGATIEATDDRFAPFTVYGARLRAIAYDLPVASAQVKSCVLLAGLLADDATTVHEPVPSRDHTERMLAAAGVTIHRNGPRVTVANTDELELEELHVPGDPSSAAFPVTAGVLVGGSRLVVERVGVNWTRSGFFRILERMGGIVVGDFEGAPGDEIPPHEPVTDLDVTAGPLVGTVVEPHEVPLAIDELPLVALLGCFAEGETVVQGAQELRLKESDRIATVVDGLRGLGAEIEATEDGFVVTGTGGLRGGTISSHGDHRLAMLGAIAGLASTEGVEVDGMEAAAVSYPTFAEDLERLHQP
jgi:3-phosphoshikimate 1-carboxyvinyltransferase